jgi:hypothetical protein
METPPMNFRRWAAGIFLCAAMMMLVFGLTLFSSRLKGTDFLVYWLLCFVFTGLAVIFALVDLAIVRRKSREEQRELINETLKQAENDVKKFGQLDSED